MQQDSPGPRTRLRAVQPDDHAAVQALFRRHGWPQRSRAGWDWALTHNPARLALDAQAGAEAGWVLEHGDQVVGFLANLPARYQLDGRALWGTTCSSYLVDDSHRAHSMGLLRAFAAQPGVDFVFSATANPNSAPLYKAFRFQPSPLPSSNQRLRWWASAAAVADHLLDRIGCSGLKPLGRAAATLPDIWRKARRASLCQEMPNGLQLTALDPTQLRADAAGPWPHRWDVWAKTFSCRPGLWIDRSAATTAWRMSDPDLSGPGLARRAALWALHHDDGRIWGTCSARLLPPTPRSPKKAELLDWAVMDQFAALGAEAMLGAVLDWARSHGAAMVDANRYSGEPALQLAALNPCRMALPAAGVWLLAPKTHDGPSAHSGRQTPAMWHSWGMTGADSDDWFNTGSSRANEHARAWVPPFPQPNVPSSTAGETALYGVSAADSSATRSAVDCTAAGSKRSMSTV